MELNLKYYTGDDQYSDGKIEDKIINYIKKYDNYEDAILKDNSWPVFYHLSNMRKNVISWYPFKNDATILEVGAGMGAITSTLCDKCKSVTSIELSKKRATAILERNKDRKNLEIIVGDFKNIKLNKKFDYVLLCGVEEYQLNSELIISFKSLLKPNGKILIAIENRLGLKYFCGANEDYTDNQFDGINGYPSNANIKTFSKDELDQIFKSVNMNANYYYMFPDYKFPQLILTDEGLRKVSNHSYIPYYYKQMDLVINERKLFEDTCRNNIIPVFANSYFLELSEEEKCKKEIEYVKFNFYRKEKYKLNTYLINDRFYKFANSKEANYQIDNLIKIEKLLDDNKIEHLKSYNQDDKIYTKYTNLPTLEDILDNLLKESRIDEINMIYDNLYDYLKRILGDEIKPDKTIFDKYNVKISKEQKNSLHFYKTGFIDIIPSNILVDKDKYILFDQEWYEENAPIEYLMYRSISYFLDTRGISDTELYRKYNINNQLFRKLEDKLVNEIHSDFYRKVYYSYTHFNIFDITLKQTHINNLERINRELNDKLRDSYDRQNFLTIENDKLSNDYRITKSRLDEIENSKGYKVLNKFYTIKSKLRKK